jgi:hypothetical protein
VIFEPLDFISKLASLVPKPGVNLTRFHGVFLGMPFEISDALSNLVHVFEVPVTLAGGVEHLHQLLQQDMPLVNMQIVELSIGTGSIRWSVSLSLRLPTSRPIAIDYQSNYKIENGIDYSEDTKPGGDFAQG